MRRLCLVLLLASCADPEDTARKVEEAFVGKPLSHAIAVIGYPEDMRNLSESGGLMSWYRTRDRDDVVALGTASGVLESTCRLSLAVKDNEVVRFQLTGDRAACGRFVP